MTSWHSVSLIYATTPIQGVLCFRIWFFLSQRGGICWGFNFLHRFGVFLVSIFGVGQDRCLSGHIGWRKENADVGILYPSGNVGMTRILGNRPGSNIPLQNRLSAHCHLCLQGCGMPSEHALLNCCAVYRTLRIRPQLSDSECFAQVISDAKIYTWSKRVKRCCSRRKQQPHGELSAGCAPVQD